MYHLCSKAKIEPRPRIFQNLRSTRQTILEQFYPRGTVCAWMGNTEEITETHYIQEMEDFREQAASCPTIAPTLTPDSVHHPGTKAENPTRFPTRAPEELARIGKTAGSE